MLVEQCVRPAPLRMVRKNKIVNLHNVTFAGVFQPDFPRRRMLERDAFLLRQVAPRASRAAFAVGKNSAQPSTVAS
jgi:hypothetical protein